MNYANYISKVGEQYFGRKFNAIRDFMPLEEYNKFYYLQMSLYMEIGDKKPLVIFL